MRNDTLTIVSYLGLGLYSWKSRFPRFHRGVCTFDSALSTLPMVLSRHWGTRWLVWVD